MFSIEEIRGEPIILFGAGAIGESVYSSLKSLAINITAFADNYISGIQKGTGCTIWSFQQMNLSYSAAAEKSRVQVLITIADPAKSKEVYAQLKNQGYQNVFELEEFIAQLALENVSWDDREMFFDFSLNDWIVEDMAKRWIEEADESVFEFGAGSMHLKTCISESIKYTPYDYIQRYDEVVFCDLNQDIIIPSQCNVSFICAALMYVHDLSKCLSQISECTKKKIIIYYTFTKNTALGRLAGYKNSVQEEKLVSILSKLGWEMTERVLYRRIYAREGIGFLFSKR